MSGHRMHHGLVDHDHTALEQHVVIAEKKTQKIARLLQLRPGET